MLQRLPLLLAGSLLLPALAGFAQSFPVFPQPIGYGVGSPYPETPRSVVAVDLNRDGRPDVATANLVGNKVGVLLNGATNTLGAVTTYAVGSSPNAIVAADFNGDLYPDLAVTSYGGQSVSVLRNDRSGRFNAAVSYPMPNSAAAYELAAGDLTGDGRPDLAVLSSAGATAQLTVLASLSNGTFTDVGTMLTLPQGAGGITIADMNADGKADVLVSNSTTATFEILRNSGTGVLTSVGRYPGAQDGVELLVADFNGDGRPDVAQADFANAATVTLATATGFAAPTTYPAGLGSTGIASADVNADGFRDIVVSNSRSNDITMLLGSATGAFTSAGSFAAGVTPYDVAVADLTGDGRPDLVTANYVQTVSQSLSVLPGLGNGRFTAAASTAINAPNGPLRLVQGDLNGDGRPDVVTVSGVSATGSNLAVLLRQADGTLAPAVTYPVGRQPEAVALADVNGDGRLDAVTANRGAASLSVLLNTTRTGTLTTATTISVPGNPTGVVAADFNADGRPDLAVSGASGNSVAVLLNTGNGQFASPLALPTGAFSTGLVATDMDGDGRPDLAAAHSTGPVAVLRNLGSGQFAAPSIITASGTPVQIIAADLTGDNRPELLTSSEGRSPVVVLRNDGTGQFQVEPQQNSFYSSGLSVANIYGNAQPEVIVTNAQYREVSILGNTNGVLSFGLVLVVSGAPYDVTVADVNADGRPDLTVANLGASAVNTFLQGGGTVTSNQAVAAAADQWQVYPNPAADRLYLRFSGAVATSPYRAELLDATGRIVLSTSLTGNLSTQELQVGKLARGSYVLRLTSTSASPVTRHLLLR
ncbi:FG-GAP-like repeat-containing protein [Hymenobacter rigui]|nr:FG-GAP-like repeat-containing protein [Hymenobacter rigui]